MNEVLKLQGMELSGGSELDGLSVGPNDDPGTVPTSILTSILW